MTFEHDVLKEILAEQKKTNELLQRLIDIYPAQTELKLVVPETKIDRRRKIK